MLQETLPRSLKNAVTEWLRCAKLEAAARRGVTPKQHAANLLFHQLVVATRRAKARQ